MKMRVRMSERERYRGPETENTSSVHQCEDTKSERARARERESERAREQESERARERESERARERESGRVGEQESERASERESKRARVRECERAREGGKAKEPVIHLVWARGKERERRNPSLVVCGHDTTENERVKERE